MRLTPLIYTPQNNIFQYFLTMLGQMVHADLVRQNEYLKVENEILRSKLGNQVRTTHQEKLKLIKYGLAVGGHIKNLISVVSYQTFRKWVNAFEDGNLKKNVHLGRPRRTSQEVIDIILRMARENLDWGYGRIMGELKKIGIKRSRNTIKRIMIEHGLNPAPKRYEDSWDAYLKRTFETLWGCDFFSQEIWTPLGKKVVFVLFFINIRTRQVHIAGITENPKELWMVNRAKYMEQFFEDDTKKILIRDGDKKFTAKFDNIFKIHNTEVKQIPYKSPNLNPYSEAFVSIIARECMNKFFIFGQAHFEYLIKNFVSYYNHQRPHSGLDNGTIGYVPVGNGKIKCKSMLGGVVRHYWRE